MPPADPARRNDVPGPSGFAPQASASRSRFTNIVGLDAVGSTNAAALEAFAAGVGEGLVVTARHQLAGRGRRGRSWMSPPGGALLCSVLFEPPAELTRWPLVASALSLAALDAIDQLAPCDVALKWPNDLICGGKKLAGVLAEAAERPGLDGGVARGLVVGLGLNLVWPPGWPTDDDGPEAATVAERATTLAACSGRVLAPETLLGALLGALEVRYDALGAPRGPAQLLTAYRARCATLGQVVRVSLEREEFIGEALGIDELGRLEVRREGSIVALDAGDVVHVRDEPGRDGAIGG